MRIFCLLLCACALVGGTARADLHDPANRADYLIISSDSLIHHSWIQALAVRRMTQGHAVQAVAMEDIAAEFGGGVASDVALRDFLFYARANWQPPQVDAVFIVGWHDVVPMHYVSYSDTITVDNFITDSFLATPPDCTRLSPVFAIGRLPWSPRWGVSLPNYFNKIVAYESEPAGNWQSRVHLIADQQLGAIGWTAVSEGMAATLPAAWSAACDYVNYPPEDPYHANHDSVMASWDAGNFLTIYNGWVTYGPNNVIDHWSDTLHIDSVSLAARTNGGRLPIVFGSMADADSLRLSPVPQALLSNPLGGAIGFVAHTGIGMIVDNNGFRLHALAVATNQAVRTLGAFWLTAVVESWSSASYHSVLLGDPAVLLPRTQAPAEEPPAPLPTEIKLLGNYPNPFNPTTTVAFELPRAMSAALRVYDITGREVATLLDGPQSAGTHRVTFDGSRLATGLYFARLEAGGQMQTRKLVLLK